MYLYSVSGADAPVGLELPDQWLWELVDEFIYQFQSFSQYRARLNKKTPDELAMINDHNTVWNVLCVLNVLHSLVDKSNIKKQLEVSYRVFNPSLVKFKLVLSYWNFFGAEVNNLKKKCLMTLTNV